MVNVLPGFKFDPRDHEVIKYLECKAKDEPLPCEGVILETNLYGEKEPWQIFQEQGGKKISRYFFTRLKKKKENGRQYFRKVGLSGGTWNGDSKGKSIHVDGREWKKVIGMKKSFSYSNKKSKEGGGDGVERRAFKWLMTEFTLSEDWLKDPSLKHSDYAVCLIRKIKVKKPLGMADDDSDNNEDDSDDDDDDDDEEEEEVVPENNCQRIRGG